MVTLGVDTSSKSCSCAIERDGRLLGEFYLNTGLTHSSVLADMVNDLFVRTGTAYSDVDRIVVTEGPGSYTGLRIGMSFVKGMALALDVPCTAVSTLAALAWGAVPFKGVICAALDARVGQYFAALFECDGQKLRRLCPDDAIKTEDIGALLPDGALLVGDGAELLHRQLCDRKLILSNEIIRFTRAFAAIAASEQFGVTYRDAAALQPDYHRKSQAEREAEAKRRD